MIASMNMVICLVFLMYPQQFIYTMSTVLFACFLNAPKTFHLHNELYIYL